MQFGVASMSSRLEKVAVRKPSAILNADPDVWHYTKVLDREKLLDQFFLLLGCWRSLELRFFGLMMRRMI